MAGHAEGWRRWRWSGIRLLPVAFLLLAATAHQAAPASEAAPAVDAARQALLKSFEQAEDLDPAAYRALMTQFETLRSAGAATAQDWRLATHLAMRAWRFDDVAAWQASASGREHLAPLELPRTWQPLPAGSAPGWWQLRAEDQVMFETATAPRAPTELWVVFHPGCGFCRRMLDQVSASAQLSGLMNRCGRWVGLMDGNFRARDFTQWAERTGQAPVQFLRSWAPAGLPPPRATPLMHVMRDGRWVQTISGWPREGREVELLAAVRAVDVEGRCVPR